MQDVSRRRDRIRTEEQVLACFLCRCYQPECRCSIAGDGSVAAWLTSRTCRTRQTNLVHRQSQVLAVVITIDHHLGVRCNESRFLLELVLQQMNGFIHRFVKEPIDKTEGEHVTALQDGLIVHAGLLERLFGQRCQRHRNYLHGLWDAKFREGVLRMILGFLEVFVGQCVRINNHDGMTVIERELIIEMRLRMVEMRTQSTYLERRGIHGYNHVGFVARRIYFAS